MTDFIEQRTDAWHEARRGRLTASMAGAALGLAPYMTPDDVVRMMVRDREGAEREFQGNPPTEWGSYNEAGAIAEFTMETGIKVRPATFISYENWSGGSPDGYTSDSGLIEVKCPYGIRKDENPKFKTVADQPHYHAQMQLCMLATGERHTWFWQWTPHGTQLERVDYDQGWIDENLPRLKQFWAMVCDEPADDHLAPMRVRVDTPEAHMMIREYDELSESIENLTARKKELLADMVEMAGERNALFGGRKLTLTKRVGQIAYAKAIKAIAPKADLEPYRGAPSEFWGLK